MSRGRILSYPLSNSQTFWMLIWLICRSEWQYVYEENCWPYGRSLCHWHIFTIKLLQEKRKRCFYSKIFKAGTVREIFTSEFDFSRWFIDFVIRRKYSHVSFPFSIRSLTWLDQNAAAKYENWIDLIQIVCVLQICKLWVYEIWPVSLTTKTCETWMNSHRKWRRILAYFPSKKFVKYKQ